jgi:hypothetical protein
MIEAILILATLAVPDELPQSIQTEDFVLFQSDPTPTRNLPDCTFRGCNNYIGSGCRSFSSWLLPAPVRIQVGCTRVTYGVINDMNYCVCHCATGDALPTPCTTQRMAAPVVSKQ